MPAATAQCSLTLFCAALRTEWHKAHVRVKLVRSLVMRRVLQYLDWHVIIGGVVGGLNVKAC
jgi:hypothetical protein